MIWDAHIHAYPDFVCRDPRAWAEKMGERHWWNLVSQKIQSWFTVDEMLKEMDASGVSKGLILGWYWENPDSALQMNDWLLSVKRDYSAQLEVFLSVHPSFCDNKTLLNDYLKAGVKGFGECLPQVQGSSYQSDDWLAICEWMNDHGLPLNLHVTEPVGHDYPGKVPTPLNELFDLIRKFPKIKWVLSHWGGGIPFFGLNSYAKEQMQNVWIDTSASPLIYDEGIWKIATQVWSTDRILFGSDFPLNLYPRKQKRARMKPFHDEFSRNVKDVSLHQKISYQNLELLLR